MSYISSLISFTYRFAFILQRRYFTAIYAMVTPFMDPVTRSKFRILGSDYFEELSAAIDESNIPTDYGGKMETAW